MKLGRCPICKSHLYIEEVLQDEAGKELLGVVAKLPASLGRFAVSYIGLFRPEKSDLSMSRAVKLLNEALALCPNQQVLTQAMADTVQTIHANRHSQRNYQPLKNHNYLKRVLESMTEGEQVSNDMAQTSTVEVKTYGSESKEENERRYQEQLARYNS